MQLLPRRHAPHHGNAADILDDHDLITGLFSQAAFTARTDIEMRRAAKEGAPLAMISFRLGVVGASEHSLGNLTAVRLFENAAHRLVSCTSGFDLVGRLDDAEFAILSPGSDFEAGLSLAIRVKEKLHEPYDLHPVEVSVAVVCGIAVYPECRAKDAPDFIARTQALVPELPEL
jgi:diguanylate cyclase (GGDEF)-like protein